MRKCPFCGAEVKPAYPYLIHFDEDDKWSLFHHCNEQCGVIITAKTKDEVIAIWEGKVDA